MWSTDVFVSFLEDGRGSISIQVNALTELSPKNIEKGRLFVLDIPHVKSLLTCGGGDTLTYRNIQTNDQTEILHSLIFSEDSKQFVRLPVVTIYIWLM